MAKHLNPEAATAIGIADKHLAGESVERRKALAMDIKDAILMHASVIANDVLAEVQAKIKAGDAR